MLEVLDTLVAWRARTDAVRRGGATLGLTMTMGGLHRGHASLFERAAASCDVAAATVFVNPLQFGDPADLAAYPRDLAADLAVAEAAGVTLVLAPPIEEIWPAWPASTATTVHVAGLADVLEGEGRPGHFDGVASVVTKLLVATGPCTAFFGEKDFQQLCVVQRLVADLALPIEVVGCPIVRERDGLALSSRNARLSAGGHRAALTLRASLEAGRAALAASPCVEHALEAMRRVVAGEPLVTLAYAAAVEPSTLRAAVEPPRGATVRLLVAGVVEGVRLIDNVAAVVGP
ncbi:MAG TPA: pantoate--beta-alanine ligase [Acidimicrobiales bacterium]|nr:pantoate--beta-alanine ligase [Acidimicrobiales bacterium]